MVWLKKYCDRRRAVGQAFNMAMLTFALPKMVRTYSHAALKKTYSVLYLTVYFLFAVTCAQGLAFFLYSVMVVLLSVWVRMLHLRAY